jgi:hypothetical protein
MVWGEGMLDAFERVGWGGLLIDADGCVIGLNGEARRHVGREIALIQGQIAATHRPANAELSVSSPALYQQKTSRRARRKAPYCCRVQTHVR